MTSGVMQRTCLFGLEIEGGLYRLTVLREFSLTEMVCIIKRSVNFEHETYQGDLKEFYIGDLGKQRIWNVVWRRQESDEFGTYIATALRMEP